MYCYKIINVKNLGKSMNKMDVLKNTAKKERACQLGITSRKHSPPDLFQVICYLLPMFNIFAGHGGTRFVENATVPIPPPLGSLPSGKRFAPTPCARPTAISPKFSVSYS